MLTRFPASGVPKLMLYVTQRMLESKLWGGARMAPALRQMRKPLTRLLVVVAAAAQAGCFTYAPAELDTVSPSSLTRLYLTAAGAERLEALDVDLMEDGGRSLRGYVEGIQGGEVRVRVPVGTRQDGPRTAQISQMVVLPLEEVRSVEERHVNRGRTVLMAVAVAAVGTGVALAILSDALRQRGDRPSPVDPNESLLPLGPPFPR